MKLDRSLFFFLIVAFISLSGFSKSTSDVTYAPSSNENSDVPFEVIVDKNALESRKDRKVTIKIISELEDWGFYAKTENGKISNKTTTSFDYERIKEDIIEDTITIYFTNNKTAREYKCSIPLIFARPVNYDDFSDILADRFYSDTKKIS